MNLWKFTRGYVKISISAERPERIVNLLLSEGICLHSIERVAFHEITAIVRFKCYMQLCEIVNARGGEVSLIEEHGLPIYTRLIRSRPMLAVSLLIGLVTILFASQRVLIINAVGCDRVSQEEILSVLQANGAAPGAAKSQLELNKLSRAVLESFDQIGFVDIRLDGVMMTAVIREINAIASAGDDNAPCSIYADKDCVIVSIIAEDGNAVVKKGQAVKRGELLVNGDITPEGAETQVKTRSKAEIYGQTAYRFSVVVAPETESLVRSSEKCRYTEAVLFGRRIIHSKVDYELYDTEMEKEAKLTACGLPVIIREGSAYELIDGKRMLSRDEMQEIAAKRADDLITDSIQSNARIIMKTTELIWQEDGSLLAVVKIQTIERIGYSRYI